MLGGDNLDLALAKAVETQSSHRSPSGELENSQDQSGAPLGERRPLERPQEQQPLNPAEFDLLRLQCRAAKETLLGNSNPTHCIVSIAGKGSRLIGNVRCFEISHELAERTLLDGFFPQVELESVPHESQGGLFEFGLPYAADPAITRHLAQFLWQHRWDGRPETAKTTMSDRIAARPDWILFNGGVLESPQIRERLRKQIENWFQDENAYSEIGELESSQLDLAVAIGAAYFGLVRRGEGVRINARLARAYYLQVATDPPMALCIMPGDAVPLDRFKLTGHPFELEIGRPIQFPILVSSTHLVHRADELLPIDLDHMRPIPPIQTVLESSRYRHAMRVPVVLETELTEIGTLDLALVTSGGSDDRSQDPSSTMRWQLAFDLRSTVETDRDAHQGHLEQTGIVDSLIVNQANLLIRETFEPKAPLDAAKSLAKRLANELGIVRHDWKPSLLRSMWQTLIDCDPNQKRHAITESRWLNLLGYCLRPGYGYAADDWRVAMTWRLVQGKLKHASNAAEAMVLWRRIAGGFTMGQQRALYQEIQSRVREILENGGRVHLANQNAMELLRLVGSLELLGAREKKLLGSLAIKAFQRSKMVAFLDATLWMLGRLGARSLVYGPANDVLNSDLIEGWVMSLTEVPQPLPSHQLALMQLTRRTGDRYRDVPVAIRELALQTLQQWNAPASYLRLVSEVTELNSEQKEAIIGESLPLGIRLRR